MSALNLMAALFSALILILSSALIFSLLHAQGDGLFRILSLISVSASAFMLLIFIKKILQPLKNLENALGTVHRGKPGPQEAGRLGPFSKDYMRFSLLLEEASLNLRGLINRSPVPILELDMNGGIEGANTAALNKLGYAGVELYGRPFKEIIGTGAADDFDGLLEDVTKGPADYSIEAPLTLKGGGVNLFRLNAVPIRESGALRGACVICLDIEDNKKLAGELARVKKEAEAASEKLKNTIRELEDFARLAVLREFKMQEIREKFIKPKVNEPKRGKTLN